MTDQRFFFFNILHSRLVGTGKFKRIIVLKLHTVLNITFKNRCNRDELRGVCTLIFPHFIETDFSKFYKNY